MGVIRGYIRGAFIRGYIRGCSHAAITKSTEKFYFAAKRPQSKNFEIDTPRISNDLAAGNETKQMWKVFCFGMIEKTFGLTNTFRDLFAEECHKIWNQSNKFVMPYDLVKSAPKIPNLSFNRLVSKKLFFLTILKLLVTFLCAHFTSFQSTSTTVTAVPCIIRIHLVCISTSKQVLCTLFAGWSTHIILAN